MISEISVPEECETSVEIEAEEPKPVKQSILAQFVFGFDAPVTSKPGPTKVRFIAGAEEESDEDVDNVQVMSYSGNAAVTAQNGRTKFATDMYQAKHEMIIEELGLTPTQQKQFMPLYEQMEREIYQVNRNARALASEVEKKKNPTDKDYEAAASALSNTRVQEGDIEAKYFEKFSKILSKKQLFQLKQAELKYTREMLSKKRNKKK